MVTGDTLPHPNPTNTLAKLLGLLEGLTSPEGGWRGEEIHLFGFAQGGSCAAELALTHHRKHPPSAGNPSVPLGSLVVISAPLLSLPTIDVSLRSQIPALLFLREGETNLGRQATGSGAEAAFTKGFKYVEKPKVPSSKRRPGDEGERMPAGQDEWRPIMTCANCLLSSAPPCASAKVLHSLQILGEASEETPPLGGRRYSGRRRTSL